MRATITRAGQWRVMSGLLALAVLLSATTARAAAPEILVTAVSGPVEVKSAQAAEWTPIAQAVRLNPGDWIKTGQDARAELRFEAGTIRIFQHTLVKVPAESTQQVSGDSGRLQKVLLENGRALFDLVKAKLRGRFEVETPRLIAGVKGTAFHVIEREGLAAVIVDEGRVQVTNRRVPNDIVELMADQYTLLRNDRLTPPAPVSADPFDEESLRASPRPEERAADGIGMTGEERDLLEETKEESADVLNDVQEQNREAIEQLREESQALIPELRDDYQDLLHDVDPLQDIISAPPLPQ
ncbi:MAG: FecR family protein [Nitrospirota bacterium]